MQPIYQELNAMPQGQGKGIDPAVVWPVSPHTLGHPRNWNHLLLAPDLLTGLAVFDMRILCRCGFLPTGPLWYCASCKEDAYRFFLSGCCMAQRRSLSGQSPFCQRKLSDSRKFNGNLFLESNKFNHKQKTQNTPTTMQSSRECRDGWV